MNLNQKGTNNLWQWELKNNQLIIEAGCFKGTLQDLVDTVYKQGGHKFLKRKNLILDACKFFKTEIPSPLITSNGDGKSDGKVNGYGYGNCDGYGKVNGYGYGNCEGKGYGYGYGYGNCDGYGKVN
ncbi:MAG TPA: hypothetical protein PKD00_08475, partial [Burkholderiales bacterium]|nr:hypothetical protein [Burkholderiales bacterium]